MDLGVGEVVLAKVNATDENDSGEKYEVQGFPTVYFINNGVTSLILAKETKRL